MAQWTFQHLATAGLLAVVVALVCRFGRVGPVGRHALWLVVLIKLVTPPFVVLPTPWARTDIAFEVGPEPAVTAEPLAASLHDSPRIAGDRTRHVGLAAPIVEETAADITPSRHPRDLFAYAWPVAMTVWIAGALMFALVEAVRISRVRRSLCRGVLPDLDFQIRVDHLARALDVASPAIRIVRGIGAPMIWSFNPFRPVLMWPDALSSELRGESLRALVVHELAHLKRRDHVVGWLELAAGCVWWWNPVFWRARTRVRENAELACDAWVVDALPESRRAYAEALLAVCAGLRPGAVPMLAAGANTGSQRFLERRLVMIMKERVPLRLSRLGLMLLGALTAAAVPVWAQRVVTVKPDGKPVTVEVKPVVTVDTQRVVEVAPMIVQQNGRIEVVPEGADPRIEVVPELSQDRDLPEDAQKLIAKFNDQQAAVRKEAEDKTAAQRTELVKQLRALQDSYTKAGKLDEALAIRSQTTRLEDVSEVVYRDSPSRFWTPVTHGFQTRQLDSHQHSVTLSNTPVALPRMFSAASHAPASILFALRDNPGATITMDVTGAEGNVWGTDVYTDDSSVAAAAVHAGILKIGERGTVKITILPGRDSYTASDRHGMKSAAFGKFEGSFKIERAAR